MKYEYDIRVQNEWELMSLWRFIYIKTKLSTLGRTKQRSLNKDWAVEWKGLAKKKS